MPLAPMFVLVGNASIVAKRAFANSHIAHANSRIGIGAGLTARPLLRHGAYGSVHGG
ncbi:MAG: hypothetical protein CBHOC_1880, partial [uncultured Caballeronia sp.]